jgi:hypothetical protein
MYYSWLNVTEANNNNSFSYIFNGTTYPVLLPDGMYEVSDLNGFLQTVMYTNGHYLVDNSGTIQYYINIAVNPVYYTITITCTPIPSVLPTGWSNLHSISLSGNTPSIIIPNTNIVSLLGFNAGTYGGGTTLFNQNAQNIPNVAVSNVINFACNMVNSSSFSNVTNYIYSFTPSVSFASQIIIDVIQPIYFKIVDGQYTSIKIQLVDETGKQVSPLDPNVVMTLLIKQS